jgi:hypothetical protein
LVFIVMGGLVEKEETRQHCPVICHLNGGTRTGVALTPRMKG